MSFKQCVFFDGGKKFHLEASNHETFFKINKEGGKWVITARFCFSEEEAKNSIDDFESLNVPESEIPKINNLIFLANKDQNGNPVEIEPVASNFMIGYDKDDVSEIILKMAVAATGKTQNGKTQNAGGGE